LKDSGAAAASSLVSQFNFDVVGIAWVPPGKWLGLARRDLQQLEAI
jgi:hypothetical protein